MKNNKKTELIECLGKIGSIVDYVKIIIDFKHEQNSILWYRGHSSSSWKLIPSVYRDSNLLQFYKQFKDFYEEFKNIKNDGKLNKFHYMFLAQHYGMKTPVLDWSTNPLIALYFAIDNYQNNNDKDFPVVYMMKPGLLNSYSAVVKSGRKDIDYPLLVDDLDDLYFEEWIENMKTSPSNITPLALESKFDLSNRISIQSGVFTCHGPDPIHSFFSINKISKFLEDDCIYRIEIKAKSVQKLKMELEALGISRDSVYTYDHRDWDVLVMKIDENTICSEGKKQNMNGFK